MLYSLDITLGIFLLIAVRNPSAHRSLMKMSGPAERMEIPTDADVETYSTADLTETIKLFGQYGTRFLTREEIRAEMPEYPL